MDSTTLHIASPIADDNPTAIQINISEPLPEFEGLDDAIDLYKADAEKLMNAIRNLPQGTKHQLLLLMLESQKVYFKGR